MFWDGRAATLEDQAGGPRLNPIEMGTPSKAVVSKRLNECADYGRAFDRSVSQGVLKNPEAACSGMIKAITAFERSAEFSPFDSKYDRFLQGRAGPS